MTDLTPVNCSGKYTAEFANGHSSNAKDLAINCTYAIPRPGNAPPTSTYDKPITMTFGVDWSKYAPETTFLKSDAAESTTGWTDYRLVRYPNATWPNPSTPPRPQIYVTSLGWCAQTYHNLTATPRGIKVSDAIVTTEKLHDNATMIGNTVLYNAKNEQTAYYVESQIMSYVAALLTQILEAPKSPTTLLPEVIDMSQFLYGIDVPAFGKALAEAMTSQVRSGGVGNMEGDNTNSTIVTGTASFSETYAYVRWRWLILPLAETVLAAMLLLFSIVLSRGQPMLKSSVLAFLAYPLHGWEEEGISVTGPQTHEKLEKAVEGMRAHLVSDEKGQLRFVRA